MIGPESTALALVMEAATEPLIVLQVCQGKLVAARDVMRMEFDDYAAAQIVRETSVILGAVADSLKARALAPAKRPGRKQVLKTQKAFAEDAEKGSAAWEALVSDQEAQS